MTRADALKDPLWQWAVPSLVLIVGLAEALADTTGSSRIFEIGVVLALALPLVMRTRAPIGAFAIVITAAVIQATVSNASQTAIPLAVIAAAGAVGRHAEEPRSWIAPLSLVLVGFYSILVGDDPPADLIVGGTVVLGVWLLGRSLRLRAQFESSQAERAALLVKQSEEREAEAVEIERARIARELHDIVGHATSLITIRLQALRRRLPPRDPTAEELKSIERDARQALSDMRRLVAVMRDTDADNRLRPPPGLNDMPDLIESVRRAGLTVDSEIAELPGTLDPGVQLAAYRVVQEALTNAIRHSDGTRVEVSISNDHGSIHIEVRDNGEPAPREQNGSGLAGMRERVALYGGTVSAGPAPDGGYRVRASLRIPEESE
jgi:signal transduction histidine kinase